MPFGDNFGDKKAGTSVVKIEFESFLVKVGSETHTFIETISRSVQDFSASLFSAPSVTLQLNRTNQVGLTNEAPAFRCPHNLKEFVRVFRQLLLKLFDAGRKFALYVVCHHLPLGFRPSRQHTSRGGLSPQKRGTG